MSCFAAFSHRSLNELLCFKMSGSQWSSFLCVRLWERVRLTLSSSADGNSEEIIMRSEFHSYCVC